MRQSNFEDFELKRNHRMKGFLVLNYKNKVNEFAILV